jgi:molybdenum cofactor cytidylyltransferase
MAKHTKRRCFAVVLAAGRSQRFGATKQLQEVDGVPMVRGAASLARAVCGDHTLLVVGHEWGNVVAATEGQCQFVTINEDYANGIGASIACAARSLAQSADCLLIMLADQPLITTDHLNALLSAWSGDDDEIVATAFAGAQGPPVLMPRATFADLARLSGDSGARKLLDDPSYRLTTVWFDPAAIDIDSPDDLRHLN